MTLLYFPKNQHGDEKFKFEQKYSKVLNVVKP